MEKRMNDPLVMIGARAIGRVLRCDAKAAGYLLRTGAVLRAFKLGARWAVSPARPMAALEQKSFPMKSLSMSSET